MSRRVVTLKGVEFRYTDDEISKGYILQDVMGFALHSNEAIEILHKLMNFYSLREADEIAYRMNVALAKEIEDNQEE